MSESGFPDGPQWIFGTASFRPKAGDRFQFERQGYFCADPDTTESHPVFNLTVPLKDTWSKIEQKQK